MGVWGMAIFSDDVAADVRAEWTDHLGDGLTPEEATERILAAYGDALEDPEDGPVIRLALAVSQWKTGRLQPAVRDAALAVIMSGADLLRWSRPADRRAREAVLAKTREMLESPPPPAKRILRRVRSETPFVVGDVFSYLHSSGNSFAFWVTKNWGDRGGMYSDVELLDFVGPNVPDIDTLVLLPARLRHWSPKPDGSVNPPEPAGFVLIHAARLPPARYQVLGNRTRPRDRPEHQRIATDANQLDDSLNRHLP